MTTLADLRAQTLDYIDHTGSSFLNADRVRDYINAGCSALHDALIDAHEDYARKTQSISLVAGTETYSLPTDYYKTLKVFYINDGRRYAVPRYNLDSIDGYKMGPLNSGTIEHWYATRYVPLVDETDTVDAHFLPGWEDYVSLFAAVRASLREKVAAGQYAQERDAVLARIIGLMSKRDETVTAIGDASRRYAATGPLYSRDRHYMYRVMGDNVHFIETEWIGG